MLRQHWDTWVKEDVGKHNMHQNKQVGAHIFLCHVIASRKGRVHTSSKSLVALSVCSTFTSTKTTFFFFFPGDTGRCACVACRLVPPRPVFRTKNVKPKNSCIFHFSGTWYDSAQLLVRCCRGTIAVSTGADDYTYYRSITLSLER